MEIVLARHAEPDWFPDGLGDADPRLTPRGREQAERLAGWVEGRPVVALWVSPARRSQETAAPLVGLEGRTLPWLQEVAGPDQAGRSPEVVHARYREARRRPVEDWWGGFDAQTEPVRDFVSRVERGLTEALAELGVALGEGGLWRVDDLHSRRAVLVVSHAGTSGAILAHLLGVPQVPWSWERFALGHAAVARVRARPVAGGAIFSLRGFNERDHLPEPLRTR